jgi:phosphoglycerol transferase MdoB-like AlkP superfamily enzyme
MYKIPIVFFDPQGRLPKSKEKVIFQQLDILPTVLDLLNVSTDYYAFGNSFYAPSKREALAYLEGTYYYFSGNKLLYFSNDRPTHLVNFTTNNLQPTNELKRYPKEVARMSLRTKALIQRYNSDLIHNKTRVP